MLLNRLKVLTEERDSTISSATTTEVDFINLESVITVLEINTLLNMRYIR